MEKENLSQNGALIAKNLRSLEGLSKLISFDYDSFMTYYDDYSKGKTELFHVFEEGLTNMDLITYLFQNFILVASILKHHVIQFEKDIDSIDFSASAKYKEIKNYLLENEHYLILLGLRNYFQHLFGLQLGFGEIGDLGEHLFIPSFTLLKFDKLNNNKENKALIDFFKNNLMGLHIAGFALECMEIINVFFKEYDKFISSYFKKEIEEYEESMDKSKTDLDMHNIYFDNLSKIIKS
jgi:hypothetical protein